MKPYYEDGSVTIYHADCRDVLLSLPRAAVTVTSPPYWDARTYEGDLDFRTYEGYCRFVPALATYTP